jgi:fructose-1,6-bisphosphatase II / sedoheptulose-1,7-bisphosphatase
MSLCQIYLILLAAYIIFYIFIWQITLCYKIFQVIMALNGNLSFEAVKVCEAASIAAYSLMGMGDEKGADKLAVDAMRTALNNIDIKGTIVIGEGERDKAPMLYIGEKVGTGKGDLIDIALDPLEGTTILATGGAGALSVIAFAQPGGLLHAPDIYMEKIAIGATYSEQIIDLDNSLSTNLKNIAKIKKCNVSELIVTILDRPRHLELIAKVREAGARILLIGDGDIAASIATSMPNGAVDVYMGTGGAPEGVLAASALRTTGGQMCGRLLFNTEEDKKRAVSMGITDLSRQYLLNDLASGDVIFAATGITNGPLLRGVNILDSGKITYSIVMHSATGTIQRIETYHPGLT